MIVASLIGVSCGLALGLRYKALALVPAHGAAALIVAVLVGSGLVGLGQACLDLLCWSVALQVAYIGLVALALSPRFAVRAERRKAPQTL
jgi:hypothetical protein